MISNMSELRSLWFGLVWFVSSTIQARALDFSGCGGRTDPEKEGGIFPYSMPEFEDFDGEYRNGLEGWIEPFRDWEVDLGS